MLRDGGHLWPREGTLRRIKRYFQNELAAPHAQRIDTTGHNFGNRIFMSFSSEAFFWLPPDASSSGASARDHRKQLCNQHQTYQNSFRQCLKKQKGVEVTLSISDPFFGSPLIMGPFWVRLTFPQRLQLCQ